MVWRGASRVVGGGAGGSAAPGRLSDFADIEGAVVLFQAAGLTQVLRSDDEMELAADVLAASDAEAGLRNGLDPLGRDHLLARFTGPRSDQSLIGTEPTSGEAGKLPRTPRVVQT